MTKIRIAAAFIALAVCLGVCLSGCGQATTAPTTVSENTIKVPDNLPAACVVERMAAHLENSKGQVIENFGRNDYPLAVATAFNHAGNDIYRDPACTSPMPYDWGQIQGILANLEGDSGSPRQYIKAFQGGAASVEVCMRYDNRSKGVCTTLRFHVVQ